MSFWAVVQSQPQAERRALAHLAWQGFATYAPRERVVRVKRGKKIATSRWLFPRYLFVNIANRWHELFSTCGVSRVLMSGEQLAQVPDGWVERMRERERNGLIVLPKPIRFRRGQRVQVTGGLLTGKRGLYQGMTAHQRELILLDVLGSVDLAPGLLRAA
jgi:transcription antitermination factor NusG